MTQEQHDNNIRRTVDCAIEFLWNTVQELTENTAEKGEFLADASAINALCNEIGHSNSLLDHINNLIAEYK